MPHDHIRVPGFGCTYVKELLRSVGEGSTFSLQFVKKDDSRSFKSLGPTLLVPLEAGRGEVTVGKSSSVLDFSTYQLIPAGSSCNIKSLVPILKVVSIDFSVEAVDAMIKEFHLDRKKVQTAYTKKSIFNRSSWVNEVCHRYIFERTIAGQTASFSARFLEIELLKEAYYASIRPAKDQITEEPRFALLPATLQKALQFLEEHLFEDIDLDRLAKAAVMSRPTLIRNFKTKLGISPIKYVWSRRLQEASQLLATGRYTIADVSGIVGYSDVSSFSHAYREYFGFAPSAHTVASRGATK